MPSTAANAINVSTSGAVSFNGTAFTGGTLSVSNGGTGIATTTAYGVLTGGTTSTGNFQNAGAGSSGQIFQSGGASSLPTWVGASANAGALRLIAATAGSNVSTISFTSGLSSYATLLIVVSGIQPATNNVSFAMVTSSNGGSSYANSGYAAGVNYNNYNSTSQTNANSTSNIILGSAISNVAQFNAVVWYQTLAGAGQAGYYHGTNNWYNGTTYVFGTLGGVSATNSTNAIQFGFSTGNFNALGTIYVYGLASS